MEIGTITDIEIIDISHEGKGIGKCDSLVIFVANTVIGDIAKVRITQMKKNFCVGELLEIVCFSKNRIEPVCYNFGNCGGCHLQNTTYASQLELKKDMVVRNLSRIGGMQNAQELTEDTLGIAGEAAELTQETPAHGQEDDGLRYRNKIQLKVGIMEKAGGKVKRVLGFYGEKSHNIVRVTDCFLAPKEFKDMIFIVEQELVKGNPGVKGVVLKGSHHTGQKMVVLEMPRDASKKGVKNVEKCVERLKSSNIDIQCIAMVRDRESTWKTLYGKEYIEEKLGELTFRISPLSFYQVNPVQMKHLYEKATEYANLTGEETLYDLYCGVGTIGLFMAKKAKKVIGIESIEAAVLDARKNAKGNKIKNAEFIHGKAEEILPQLRRAACDDSKATAMDAVENVAEGKNTQGHVTKVLHREEKNVVILDPPRGGCEAALLDEILLMVPERIVYISCNPSTLARDLKALIGQGSYEVRKVQPVDMFGQTVHVETVCLLNRIK